MGKLFVSSGASNNIQFDLINVLACKQAVPAFLPYGVNQTITPFPGPKCNRTDTGQNTGSLLKVWQKSLLETMCEPLGRMNLPIFH